MVRFNFVARLLPFVQVKGGVGKGGGLCCLGSLTVGGSGTLLAPYEGPYAEMTDPRYWMGEDLSSFIGLEQLLCLGDCGF